VVNLFLRGGIDIGQFGVLNGRNGTLTRYQVCFKHSALKVSDFTLEFFDSISCGGLDGINLTPIQ
jgi:hypothetical protein